MLGALVGGLVLIWLGTTFFLEQNGLLSSEIWWAYFLAGVGAILVLQGAVIYSRGHIGLGPVIGGVVLIFIGLGTIAAFNFNFVNKFWPLLLVAIGILVIIGGFTARRRVPAP